VASHRIPRREHKHAHEDREHPGVCHRLNESRPSRTDSCGEVAVP
jgi:hypothetical protein